MGEDYDETFVGGGLFSDYTKRSAMKMGMSWVILAVFLVGIIYMLYIVFANMSNFNDYYIYAAYAVAGSLLVSLVSDLYNEDAPGTTLLPFGTSS